MVNLEPEYEPISNHQTPTINILTSIHTNNV
jgi:hypothetical protein